MSGEPEFEHLDVEDLIDLVTAPLAVRDAGLLGSAAARPRTTVFGRDAYPDIWSKAAVLLQSVVTNHALVDDNKRLGWLATAVFLELDGVAASIKDVHDLVIVAAEHHSVDEIAAQLRPGRRR